MSNLEIFGYLFNPISKIDATYKVFAVARYYPEHVEVYIPKIPFDKTVEGLEIRPNELIKIRNNKIKTSTEDTKERSIRRTRRTIRDYVFCNTFELFVTFTFKSDRYDIGKCKQKMADWLKREQARKGKFEYLIVPEYHKDGALHFHALIKGYTGKIKKSYNKATGKPIIVKGKQVYELPGYKSGFTNVKKIDDTLEARQKAGCYIGKYVTKDMVLIHGKNRYWASKGLKLPITETNPDNWYLNETPTFERTNEYGKTLTFNKTALPKGWTPN